MLHEDLQYLPIELQATLIDMHASGASDDRLNRLILLILADREAKTTSLQLELVKIHDSINRQIGRLGDKLSDDLRTQSGAGNQMIVDIHAMVQQQGAAVVTLRAEFLSFGERVSDNTMRIEGLERKVSEHDQSRDQSIAERQLLREDMDESKAHRARMQTRMDTDLPAIFQELSALSAAVQRMEQLLAIAQNHERDSEAGG